MHCSSLGEFEQGRPVLEALRKQFPGYRCVLSFFSPSGYEVRKIMPGPTRSFTCRSTAREMPENWLMVSTQHSLSG
ncbi:MAG: glycosyltransferase N-terminal domain-containing protein [Ferruginibacter sp.]